LIHDLDEQYRRAAHECDLVVRDEEARRLKVRTLVFRDDASSLKDQLAQRDVRIRELVEQVDIIRAQLDEANEKSRRQEKLVQSQAREINNLKVSGNEA
jgi:Ni,Fe-hydrogenase III large subunit